MLSLEESGTPWSGNESKGLTFPGAKVLMVRASVFTASSCRVARGPSRGIASAPDRHAPLVVK